MRKEKVIELLERWRDGTTLSPDEQNIILDALEAIPHGHPSAISLVSLAIRNDFSCLEQRPLRISPFGLPRATRAEVDRTILDVKRYQSVKIRRKSNQRFIMKTFSKAKTWDWKLVAVILVFFLVVLGFMSIDSLVELVVVIRG